jgi:hypothetical protein
MGVDVKSFWRFSKKLSEEKSILGSSFLIVSNVLFDTTLDILWVGYLETSVLFLVKAKGIRLAISLTKSRKGVFILLSLIFSCRTWSDIIDIEYLKEH